MWLVRFLKRVFSHLFGSSKRQDRPISLNSAGSVFFAGDVGAVMPQICSVTAFQGREVSPAEGISIRYRVTRGPLQFSRGETEVVVKTDLNGNAAVDASFTSVGPALVVAELLDDPDAMIFFRGHSDQTTHRLFLYSAPTFPVDPGIVTVRIMALDLHDRPVTSAKLIFEGTVAPDTAVSGEVRELGNGEYQGSFQTNVAGPWYIFAQDVDTKVTTHTCIHILPGEPNTIRLIGETDPRMSPPYGQLLLRARLEDSFGNALDPHRIRCVVGDQFISQQVVIADEIRFPITFPGYGSVDVKLSDSESVVSTVVTIPFAAAWLKNPGLVNVGSTFRTVLYALPPPDRPAQRATIEIEFDPQVVSFAALEQPPTGGPGLTTTQMIEGNLLIITVESEIPVVAQEYRDGVAICTVVWNCMSESEACFALVGKMSPSTPKWKLCVDQKRELQSCICINVIYPPGNNTAKSAGIAAANEAATIISSAANVAQCCPILRVGVKECRISNADWLTIAGLIGTDGGGRPTVTANAQYAAVRNTGICQKSKCINLYMIQVNVPVPGGTEQGRTLIGPPGTAVIDPTAATSGNNVGAHEVGHALGLNGNHSSAKGDVNNLMTGFQPHGIQLTPEQCETIFNNIDEYPC